MPHYAAEVEEGVECDGGGPAIDIHEGETVDARAFKALVQAAVAQNSDGS